MGQKILNIFLFTATLILTTGLIFTLGRVDRVLKDIKTQISTSQNLERKENISKTDGSLSLERIIDEKISQALSTISAQTNVITALDNPDVSNSKNISYISLGETYSTTSTDWVDVPGSGVYIDLEADYGKSAKVSWGAYLKVAHANGKAFARLYDDTNKIAVNFSEIETENNSDYKLVDSRNLSLWKGKNLYKVQIKSLNSFEVSYTSGKLKINY